MVVDHAYRLHVRVHRSRSHEGETSHPQIGRETIGCGGRLRHPRCVRPGVDDGPAIHETPDIGVEAPEFLGNREEGASILDRRLDLSPVPDNARVQEELFDSRRGESGQLRGIETGVGGATSSLALSLSLPQALIAPFILSRPVVHLMNNRQFVPGFA